MSISDSQSNLCFNMQRIRIITLLRHNPKSTNQIPNRKLNSAGKEDEKQTPCHIEEIKS